MTHTQPTPEQVLEAMSQTEHNGPVLENGAWRAIDVTYAIPGLTDADWPKVFPVMEQLEREGKIVRVKIRNTRTPRFRLVGT